MSSTQKKITPTQNLVGEATKELKRISNTVWQDFWIHRDNGESVNLLDELSSRLRRTHEDYFRNMRWDREERANKALENRLEKRLRLKLRDELKAELKAELRAEILDEQKEEAAAELERQIQEGLEGWSTGDVPEI
jgi:regulator of protease activity HflC (stomatin/prohibitin superfamily)